MSTPGLRERKKLRMRGHIAGVAATLFAERGYENVTVADVAAAADVAEKTVYNYFPAKQHLVLDRDDEIRGQFCTAIRDRTAGTSPAAAIRPAALGLAEAIRAMPADQLRGSLGYLSRRSPAVRLLCLGATDQLADAIAAAIAESAPAPAPAALIKVQATALAWVSQTVIDEAGRLAEDGRSPDEIAGAVALVVTAILDDLDHWLSGGPVRHN